MDACENIQKGREFECCEAWPPIVTEDRLEKVSVRLTARQPMSLRKLAQQTGMPYSSCHEAMKKLKTFLGKCISWMNYCRQPVKSEAVTVNDWWEMWMMTLAC
jgi:hypothetical protein